MHYSSLYDHVLSELEFGRTENGISLLVGMLDMAEMQSGAARQASAQLQGHALHRMLLEDPLLADAQKRPSNPVHRLNMLGQNNVADEVSSTGRRLFAATRAMAFTRALRHRREHAERKLFRAWRSGQKIWLIVDPGCEIMASMAALDTSNIVISDEISLRQLSASTEMPDAHFDLILAPHLPDLLTTRALRQWTARICRHLSATGEFAMSALLPRHPGAGWRRACFHWEPKCHAEQDLAHMAATGLNTHSYQDETGCIAWVEMRRA